jgi:hypothetical protein
MAIIALQKSAITAMTEHKTSFSTSIDRKDIITKIRQNMTTNGLLPYLSFYEGRKGAIDLKCDAFLKALEHYSASFDSSLKQDLWASVTKLESRMCSRYSPIAPGQVALKKKNWVSEAKNLLEGLMTHNAVDVLDLPETEKDITPLYDALAPVIFQQAEHDRKLDFIRRKFGDVAMPQPLHYQLEIFVSMLYEGLKRDEKPVLQAWVEASERCLKLYFDFGA